MTAPQTVEGLREAAQFLCDRLAELEWMDDDLEAAARDYFGHVDPAVHRLRAALVAPVNDGWRTDLDAVLHGQANSVIVAVTGGGRAPVVGEAYFDPDAYDGTWWWAGTSHGEYHDSPIEELMHGSVTYWMPLPAAPAITDGAGS